MLVSRDCSLEDVIALIASCVIAATGSALASPCVLFVCVSFAGRYEGLLMEVLSEAAQTPPSALADSAGPKRVAALPEDEALAILGTDNLDDAVRAARGKPRVSTAKAPVEDEFGNLGDAPPPEPVPAVAVAVDAAAAAGTPSPGRVKKATMSKKKSRLFGGGGGDGGNDSPLKDSPSGSVGSPSGVELQGGVCVSACCRGVWTCVPCMLCFLVFLFFRRQGC